MITCWHIVLALSFPVFPFDPLKTSENVWCSGEIKREHWEENDIYVTKYKQIGEISSGGFSCLGFFHNPRDGRVTRYIITIFVCKINAGHSKI